MSQIFDEADDAYRKWKEVLDEDRPKHYRIGDDPAKPIPCSMLDWARSLEDRDERNRVGRFDFWWGTRVSTIFLGLDHGWGPDDDSDEKYLPVLWESMAFPWYGRPGEESRQERYTSYEEALRGHKRMVWQTLLDDLITLPKGIWRILRKGTPTRQAKQQREEIKKMIEESKNRDSSK